MLKSINSYKTKKFGFRISECGFKEFYLFYKLYKMVERSDTINPKSAICNPKSTMATQLLLAEVRNQVRLFNFARNP